MEEVHVGYVQNFSEDFLDSLYFLLKQAKEHRDKVDTFAYILPIIVLLICFLESNINDIINSFLNKYNSSNIDDKKQELMFQICNDFIDMKNTSFLEKYYIIMKYFRGIDIKSDNRHEKVNVIRRVRNTFIHDKSYTIYPTKGDKDEIVKLLENYIKPKDNSELPLPQWALYVNYDSICWMAQSVFEFYLWYTILLFPNEKPRYQSKIEKIISWHHQINLKKGCLYAK